MPTQPLHQGRYSSAFPMCPAGCALEEGSACSGTTQPGTEQASGSATAQHRTLGSRRHGVGLALQAALWHPELEEQRREVA